MSSIRLTAELSCYSSPNRYAGSTGRQLRLERGTAMTVTAAENFICDGPVCTCDGLADCTDMFGTDLCGPVALCDSTQGLVCGCIRQ